MVDRASDWKSTATDMILPATAAASTYLLTGSKGMEKVLPSQASRITVSASAAIVTYIAQRYFTGQSQES